jgi:hypothetical protein
MPAPLTDVERELLNAIALGDEPARRVLADYWLDGRDEARGALVHLQCAGAPTHDLVAEHGERWRRAAVEAGFPVEQLGFTRGFAPALVVDPDEPFARSPDAFRLSPRLYCVERIVRQSRFMVVAEARCMTATGVVGRFALKYPRPPEDSRLDLIKRERILLSRLSGTAGVGRLVEVAAIRDDFAPNRALVLDWGGENLRTVLDRASGGLGEAFAISVGLQLCDVLVALRDAAVLHTDLQPDHVLVDRDGVVTLIDFENARCDLENLPMSRRNLVIT